MDTCKFDCPRFVHGNQLSKHFFPAALQRRLHQLLSKLKNNKKEVCLNSNRSSTFSASGVLHLIGGGVIGKPKAGSKSSLQKSIIIIAVALCLSSALRQRLNSEGSRSGSVLFWTSVTVLLQQIYLDVPQLYLAVLIHLAKDDFTIL